MPTTAVAHQYTSGQAGDSDYCRTCLDIGPAFLTNALHAGSQIRTDAAHQSSLSSLVRGTDRRPLSPRAVLRAVCCYGSSLVTYASQAPKKAQRNDARMIRSLHCESEVAPTSFLARELRFCPFAFRTSVCLRWWGAVALGWGNVSRHGDYQTPRIK